ncbi:MAG: hypothetical protein NC489_20420 [Ruminococcus flavefaciens]|nr:hypothetical protein [Ruminococcus flavefaciens]
MNSYNLIGICLDSLSSDTNTFVETGKYKTAVQVIYKINNDNVQQFQLKRPIEIFHKNMLYKDFESIAKNNNGTVEFMSMPAKAFRQMQRYTNKEVEKVLADMTMSVIVKILDSVPEREYNVFFIDSRDSNKLIGRLGYMYFNNTKNIFSFVSYKTDNLMTDTLRNERDILEFDIDYFKRHADKNMSTIVPNDFMESLLQTVFYRITGNEKDILPLRCDIFSQGNSNKEIQTKANILREILQTSSYITPPFKYATTSNSYIELPQVLYECMNFRAKINSLPKILEDRKK